MVEEEESQGMVTRPMETEVLGPRGMEKKMETCEIARGMDARGLEKRVPGPSSRGLITGMQGAGLQGGMQGAGMQRAGMQGEMQGAGVQGESKQGGGQPSNFSLGQSQ
ncbi:hypothetical protein A6R68_05619, partial [Neotoma lepida]